MADNCKRIDRFASWLIFVLVISVIIGVGVTIIKGIVSSPVPQELIIRFEAADSIGVAQNGEMVYSTKEIDSLINLVRTYESELDEKYEYLLENRETDDRLKTLGALIVTVIVSLCSFWGYKSMKDLREDIKSNTESTSEHAVNKFLETNLQSKVDDALNKTYKSEIVSIIKSHVIDTLNSSDDLIVKTKVNERIESEEFEKRLKVIIEDKVIEVVNEMTSNFGREILQREGSKSTDDTDIQLT